LSQVAPWVNYKLTRAGASIKKSLASLAKPLVLFVLAKSEIDQPK